MHSAKQLHKYIISKIEAIYGEQEAGSIAFILMEYFGVYKQDYVLDNQISISKPQLLSMIKRLENHEPIQYVLNEAWFFGRKFHVDKFVLIPRPETEELCQLIIENQKSEIRNQKIIDIGTGSGCIPITLKLEMPNCEVSALDISEEVLNVAKRNAENLSAEINFIQKDILIGNIDLSEYEIVVSNPPYVLNSEKELMKQNVLDNEPHLALFVEDHNPLIFYKKIIQLCVTNKVKQLYFEINERYSEKVKELMVTNGYRNVSIKKDIQEKARMIYGNL